MAKVVASDNLNAVSEDEEEDRGTFAQPSRPVAPKEEVKAVENKLMNS